LCEITPDSSCGGLDYSVVGSSLRL